MRARSEFALDMMLAQPSARAVAHSTKLKRAPAHAESLLHEVDFVAALARRLHRVRPRGQHSRCKALPQRGTVGVQAIAFAVQRQQPGSVRGPVACCLLLLLLLLLSLHVLQSHQILQAAKVPWLQGQGMTLTST